MTVFGEHRGISVGLGAKPGLRPGRGPGPRSRLALMPLLLALAGPGGASEPRHVLGEGVQLRCQPPAETRLRCDYRLLSPKALEQVSARMGGLDLPAPGWASYEQPEGSIAILILVDTSDPGRRPAIEKNSLHINALLDAAQPHHRFGLALFDSNLELLAAIGSSPDLIRAKASTLSPAGRTTELYRTALEAIRLLEDHAAHRRALLIMSDGLAEDRAYFHSDVVAAARTAGVAVFGIGYPRSVPLSVGLQTLRRLAEETGGLYADTGERFELAHGFFADVLSSLDRGGRLTLDLLAATEAGFKGEQILELDFALAGNHASATLPVELPGGPAVETVVKVVEVRVPELVEVPTLIEVPVPSATGAGAPGVNEKSPAQTAVSNPGPSAAKTVWLWYVLLPGTLLIALALFLLLALKTRQTERDDLIKTGPSKATRSLAFLESLDGSSHRHAVTRTAYRIGRHSDNDLTIRDASVSRQHAEIHRRRNGSFTITDLDSMNGVFVNQKKIDSVTLADGDIIEIGDMSYRFRMKEHAEPTGDETAAQKFVNSVTRLPGATGR